MKFACQILQNVENIVMYSTYIFHILQYFATKLDNCMNFRMLFPAVLIDFPNLKVCLIGKWTNNKYFDILSCESAFKHGNTLH